jgi:hypothetical protein
VTEAEERELWEMVCAAFDVRGTREFQARIDVIAEKWQGRYEYWLLRNRDRAAERRKRERRAA